MSEASTQLPSVFDNESADDERNERMSDPTRNTTYSASAEDDQPTSFDLKPPPPAARLTNVEHLSERLFSADHLKLILRDATLYSRFRSFLQRYRPDAARTLRRHIETQKAILAIGYANAIAGDLNGESSAAAVLDETFDQHAGDQIDGLVSDALPAYVTNLLVQVATETLVKEITGHSMPLLRDLVLGLAEVYCLTDPALPDNPIVYASEEFYRCTQYGREYVLGRNCRFLQGPHTSRTAITRLSKACQEGQEVCEAVLNYRRDGSPFLNLLMIAPLFDNRGATRYFIGAQIDVTGLIEEGRGIESFARLLAKDSRNPHSDKKPTLPNTESASKSPQDALADLSELMDETDVEVVTRYARRGGPGSRGRSNSQSSSGSARQRPGTERRYIGLEDSLMEQLWPAPQLGSSGRLPGVFQNYLLVRPYPSLRITFTSPTLRIPGLLQSKFMDRIGGQPHIREGMLSALENGVGVTARVEWLSMQSGAKNPSNQVNQLATGIGRPDSASTTERPATSTSSSNNNTASGKPRWLHCTPLFGSDGKVGVWMVVMVEREEISGGLNVAEKVAASYYAQGPGAASLPRPVDSGGTQRVNSNKLYRDYLRREGRVDSIVESSTFSAAPQSQPNVPLRQSSRTAERKLPPSTYQAPPYPNPYAGRQTSGSQRSTQSDRYTREERSQIQQSPSISQAAQRPYSPQQQPLQPQQQPAKHTHASMLSPQEREHAAHQARVLAERAMAGEEGFREF